MQRRDEEALGLHIKEAITFWSVTLFFKCYPTNYPMQKGSSNIVQWLPTIMQHHVSTIWLCFWIAIKGLYAWIRLNYYQVHLG
jgi:hypothetical protein